MQDVSPLKTAVEQSDGKASQDIHHESPERERMVNVLLGKSGQQEAQASTHKAPQSDNYQRTYHRFHLLFYRAQR